MVITILQGSRKLELTFLAFANRSAGQNDHNQLEIEATVQTRFSLQTDKKRKQEKTLSRDRVNLHLNLDRREHVHDVLAPLLLVVLRRTQR